MERIIPLVRSFQVAPDEKRSVALGEVIIYEIGPLIKGFVSRRIPTAEREDVLGDVFFAIAEGLEAFRGETDSQFLAWCYRIARNRIVDFYRAGNPSLKVAHEELTELVAEAASEELEWNQLNMAKVWKLLHQIDPVAFQIAVDRFVRDIGWNELKEEYGKTGDALRMQMRRALQQVRTELTRTYAERD